jgi:hypothetical protein
MALKNINMFATRLKNQKLKKKIKNSFMRVVLKTHFLAKSSISLSEKYKEVSRNPLFIVTDMSRFVSI